MKHASDCLCDNCYRRLKESELLYMGDWVPIEKPIDPRIANLDKAIKLMDALGIPQRIDSWSRWSDVYAVDLYDIFMDDEKLKVLVSKLRNKAFW